MLFHINLDRLQNVVSIASVVAALTVCFFMRVIQLLYRRRVSGKPKGCKIKAIAYYQQDDSSDLVLSDAVHMNIWLPRKLNLVPGQYVYVCIPTYRNFAFAQLHPLYICWWREKEGGTKITFLIQKRKGWSYGLLPANLSNVLIEGPFGNRVDIRGFSTALLFATGVGIAPQIPFLRDFLDSHGSDAGDQRITLYWEMDQELQLAWVTKYMNKIIEMDTRQILQIKIYIRNPHLKIEQVPLGKRINRNYDEMHADTLVSAGVLGRQGKTIIIGKWTKRCLTVR